MLEAEYAGCRICYRRVKYPMEGQWKAHRVGLHWTANYQTSRMVNELVINGYVYAEMEMAVEHGHMLSAVVNGHRIQAGSKYAATFCYIDVDGVRIAKKIRWV